MENSKLKHIFGVLILSFLLYSCVREEVDHTKMVVEGWIDAGKHPIVMLHTSYSLSLSEPDSTTLLDVLEQDTLTDDKILLRYLSENADSRLRSIVATIQREQNQIIRSPLKFNYLIQGVAGSGKTTVALHRIAYLIYNEAKNIRPLWSGLRDER